MPRVACDLVRVMPKATSLQVASISYSFYACPKVRRLLSKQRAASAHGDAPTNSWNARRLPTPSHAVLAAAAVEGRAFNVNGLRSLYLNVLLKWVNGYSLAATQANTIFFFCLSPR